MFCRRFMTLRVWKNRSPVSVSLSACRLSSLVCLSSNIFRLLSGVFRLAFLVCHSSFCYLSIVLGLVVSIWRFSSVCCLSVIRHLLSGMFHLSVVWHLSSDIFCRSFVSLSSVCRLSVLCLSSVCSFSSFVWRPSSVIFRLSSCVLSSGFDCYRLPIFRL